MTKGMDGQEAEKRTTTSEMRDGFLRATRAGDTKKVNDYIASGADINVTNQAGLTALHLAAKEGFTTVVRQLILNGANVNASSNKGNTALHIASLAGYRDVVKALLDANADVNCQSNVGFTSLYMAAQENHLDIVNLLLNKGANQSLTTEDGFTPLAVALQQGHDRVVATLLERDTKTRGGLPALHVAARKDDVNAANLLLANPDVNVNHQSQPGFTALHISGHYGTTDVGRLLIQRGADVNFQAKNNITPLHVAAKWGRLPMVKLLLEHGALVDCQTRDGLTPLHCAARSGHNSVCTTLIDAGCNPSAKTRNGLTPLHMAAQGNHDDVAKNLISRGASLQATTGDFLNPLHVAAHCGNVKVARLLLDRGCDMNARALNGFTPLHIACKKNKVAIVELLLQYGAQIACTTEAGLTPLHVAAFIGSSELVRILLDKGAVVDQATMRCETALHLAARNCQLEVANLLLKSHATVDACAKDDQTPLHIAVLTGNGEMVNLLLRSGADANLTTRDAYTALHIAAKDGRSDIVQCLLAVGADPDARTKRGFSPLHLAAKRGRAEVARALLQARRDNVNAVGRNGLTPLHMAAHYNHVQLIELLLDHGAEAGCAAGNGYTALHIAAKKNHLDVASLLLANDKDTSRSSNVESRCGFTPLHLAAQEGHIDMVDLLLLNGAEPNHQARNGLTPMHLAAQEDRVTVAQNLVAAGADVSPVTVAGYTPLHTACHFGRLNMVRFLLASSQRPDINRTTSLGFTPLHLATLQGHSEIVYLLLDHGADPNVKNSQGITAAQIARRQHYPTIFDTLRTVTTVVTNWEEEIDEVLLDSPEFNVEAAAVDSDDEGIRPPTARQRNGKQEQQRLSKQQQQQQALGQNGLGGFPSQYQVERVIAPSNKGVGQLELSSPHDNDLIWSELEYLSQPLVPKESGRDRLHGEFSDLCFSPVSPISLSPTRMQMNPDVEQVPVGKLSKTPFEYDEPTQESLKRDQQVGLSVTLASDVSMSETTKVLGGPGDHLDAEWEMETEPLNIVKKPLLGGFLVSFLVDARGGILESKRYPGLRFIIPPNASVGPLRLICRFLRYPHFSTLPPLNDGEGLACRMMEVGPVGVRFNAPVLIEIPYCASLDGKQREIIALRSDNGENWKEHPYEATDQAVQDALGEYFADAVPSGKLRERRVHRILTSSIPQYFALVTRFRQDLVLVGPEGSLITSSVSPSVQVCFPPGALQKKIRVGLQVQVIPAPLVSQVIGPRIAVSPIVTIEPRRRKFHRPITITIPLPTNTITSTDGQQQHNQQDLSTIRLLCSITGGTQRAVWEDITGSSPFSLQKNCISFTTTVSARLWLIDCPNLSEVPEMASQLYRAAIAVPYFGKFIVYCRRHHREEAQLRCVCLTDDTEQKTLECQEGFEVLARGESVEILHEHPVWLESAGNLVPVAKSGDQLNFTVHAFEENRLNMLIRVKDINIEPDGKLAFMPQQRISGGPSVDPLTVLAISLPHKVVSSPSTALLANQLGNSTSSDYMITDSMKPASSDEEIIDSIARSDLDLKKVADSLGPDWPKLAEHLGLSVEDRNAIAAGSESENKKAYACLILWQDRFGKDATGSALGRALRQTGRSDILKRSMQNIALVQDEYEFSHALQSLDQEEQDDLKPKWVERQGKVLEMKEMGKREISPEEEEEKEEETKEDEAPVLANGEGMESPIPTPPSCKEAANLSPIHQTSEERRAVLEDLIGQLELSDQVADEGSDRRSESNEPGVIEDVLIAEVKKRSSLESSVPLSLIGQEDEEDEETQEISDANPPTYQDDARP